MLKLQTKVCEFAELLLYRFLAYHQTDWFAAAGASVAWTCGSFASRTAFDADSVVGLPACVISSVVMFLRYCPKSQAGRTLRHRCMPPVWHLSKSCIGASRSQCHMSALAASARVCLILMCCTNCCRVEVARA